MNKIKPICLLSAPVFNRSGYGELSTDIAKCLIKYDKFNLKIKQQRWGECQKVSNIKINNDDYTDDILKCIIPNDAEIYPEVYISITVPNEFQPIGKYNIGITAGIESTCASVDFILGINRMDLIMTLSQFSKNVFLDTKIINNTNGIIKEIQPNQNIEVFTWGIDTNVFKKTDEHIDVIDSMLSSIPENFAFLFVGQWNDRKNIQNLIKIFCEAFINTPGEIPCLILKTNGCNFSTCDRYRILNMIHDVQVHFGENCPNVYVIHGELSNKELNALYNHPKIKAGIAIPRGEGFGRSYLQHTMSGKPIFISGWGGHLDFMNSEYSLLFPGTLVDIPQHLQDKYFVNGAKWYEPAYPVVKYQLKQFVYNYIHNTEEYNKICENADKLRLDNINKFNIDLMYASFESIMDKHIPHLI